MRPDRSHRSRISPRIWIVAWAVLAASATVFAGPARAQSLPPAAQPGCYNIIPAQPGTQPAILIDRCSGLTWQLVARSRGGGSARRRGHLVYVWSPIDRSESQVERAAPQPAPAPAARSNPPASAAHGNAKCFQFNGRTFCE